MKVKKLWPTFQYITETEIETLANKDFHGKQDHTFTKIHKMYNQIITITKKLGNGNL